MEIIRNRVEVTVMNLTWPKFIEASYKIDNNILDSIGEEEFWIQY